MSFIGVNGLSRRVLGRGPPEVEGEHVGTRTAACPDPSLHEPTRASYLPDPSGVRSRLGSRIRALGSSHLPWLTLLCVRSSPSPAQIRQGCTSLHAADDVCSLQLTILMTDVYFPRSIQVQAPAMSVPTDAQFYDADDPSKPSLAFLKNHLYREGRLTEEQALFILQT